MITQDQRIYIIYYDGQPFDFVQRKETRRVYSKPPKRMYWKISHAKTALRGILDLIENQPESRLDPSKFEIRAFQLVPVDS